MIHLKSTQLKNYNDGMRAQNAFLLIYIFYPAIQTCQLLKYFFVALAQRFGGALRTVDSKLNKIAAVDCLHAGGRRAT
jgi:hypothetical protein